MTLTYGSQEHDHTFTFSQRALVMLVGCEEYGCPHPWPIP